MFLSSRVARLDNQSMSSTLSPFASRVETTAPVYPSSSHSSVLSYSSCSSSASRVSLRSSGM